MLDYIDYGEIYKEYKTNKQVKYWGYIFTEGIDAQDDSSAIRHLRVMHNEEQIESFDYTLDGTQEIRSLTSALYAAIYFVDDLILKRSRSQMDLYFATSRVIDSKGQNSISIERVVTSSADQARGSIYSWLLENFPPSAGYSDHFVGAPVPMSEIVSNFNKQGVGMEFKLL